MANAIQLFTAEIERYQHKFADALPKHCEVSRFKRLTINAIAQNPRLLDADRNSLWIAVMNAAQLGLEPDPTLGHIYFIPRKGKVQMALGYKGLMHLAYRSEKVLSADAAIVVQGDAFEFQKGTDGYLRHTPAFKDIGNANKSGAKVTHVWAMATLAGGHKEFDVMSVEEIDAIRKRSAADGKSFSPWQTDWGQMARKTVLRRLFKLLPVSTEVQSAIGMDEANEAEGPEQYQGAPQALKEALKPKQLEVTANEPVPVPDDSDDLDYPEEKIPDEN